jgi:hypothetical protein
MHSQCVIKTALSKGTGVGATPVIPKEDAAVNRLRNVMLSNRNQRRPSGMCFCVRGFYCFYECPSAATNVFPSYSLALCMGF